MESEQIEVLRKPVKVEKFGIAIRMVDYRQFEKYGRSCVEWVPLKKDGSLASEEWASFAGSPGMDDSCFKKREDAEGFFDDILKLDRKQMLSKYPRIWVE